MITKPATNLTAGDVITYCQTRTTVLGHAEAWRDRFGRDMLRFWARREDTGAEGWIHYGPDALAPLD